MSWTRTNSLKNYLGKRVLRIYPAFIVAYLLSVFILGPLVGAAPWHWIGETVFRLIALQTPKIYPGQLKGLHYPDLNGSMWTIAYEFRCYLLVAVLGMTGLLRRKRLMLCLTAIGVIALISTTFHVIRAPIDALSSNQILNQIIGIPQADIRLTTTFFIGICFYLFRDKMLIDLDFRFAFLTGLIAIALLFRDPHLAEASLITFGAISLFWVAFKANLGCIQKVNDDWDISYGVYLYGWPIATAIRWFDRGVSPWMLAAETLPLALAAGAASWWGVEKWTKYIAFFKTTDRLLPDS